MHWSEVIWLAVGFGAQVLFGARSRRDPLIATGQLVGLGINLRHLIVVQSPNPDKSTLSAT